MKKLLSLLLFLPALACAQTAPFAFPIGVPASGFGGGGGGGGGGGSPAGSNTQVQYNASGSFGANSGFTSDTSGNVTVNSLTGGSATIGSGTGLAYLTSGAISNLSVTGSGNALTALNSITSAAASPLVLATGTFGTAVTFASATGNATFAQNVTISGTTASTSTSTGALVLSGASAGLGVAGAGYFGGLLSVGGTLGTGGTVTIPSNASFAWQNGSSIAYSSGIAIGSAATIALTGATGAAISITRGPLVLNQSQGFSAAAWGTAGIVLTGGFAAFTDNSTAASGTAAIETCVSFPVSAFGAANAGVVTTNAVNVYIAGAPSATTNQTFTNAWSLYINSGNVYLGSTTDQSGANTGSFQTAGGAYIAKSLLVGTTIQTGAGATAAAQPWNLGGVRTSTALTPSTTTGIQVSINGTLYTLAVLSSNP